MSGTGWLIGLAFAIFIAGFYFGARKDQPNLDSAIHDFLKKASDHLGSAASTNEKIPEIIRRLAELAIAGRRLSLSVQCFLISSFLLIWVSLLRVLSDVQM